MLNKRNLLKSAVCGMLLLPAAIAMAGLSSTGLRSNDKSITLVEQRLPAAKNNSAIQSRIESQCTFLANVFYQVAVFRDQKVAPQTVLDGMLASELPDDIKHEAVNIINMVYSAPGLTADEIGFAIFGQCMELNTGVRRHT